MHMTHRIIVLWTTPRSRSTAFERMMIERGDHTVIDEPFSARYYFSSESRSNRYEPTEPDATGEKVLGDLLREAESGPVFVKDMAYHTTGMMSPELLANFTNTFLVREPTATLSSLARKWPDHTAEEAGFDALGRAFDILVSAGSTPPVIDGDDLAARPEEVIAAWCEAVGIPFMAEALSWEPGMVPQWIRWQDWYEGVAASTGFVAPTSGAAPDTAQPASAPAADPVLERAAQVYRRLCGARIGTGHPGR